jgi:hypothetical protein
VIAAYQRMLQFAEARQTYCTGFDGTLDEVGSIPGKRKRLQSHAVLVQICQRIIRPIDGDDTYRSRQKVRWFGRRLLHNDGVVRVFVCEDRSVSTGSAERRNVSQM